MERKLIKYRKADRLVVLKTVTPVEGASVMVIVGFLITGPTCPNMVKFPPLVLELWQH